MPTRHRRKSFPALLVALLLALGGTGAGAAEPGAARAAARRHFERGTTLYKEGRYAEAAAAFEAAYQTLANGVVLYNLGQCYEKLGDLQRAIGYYRDYLRMVPGAEDRPLVESLIARLEKRYTEESRPQVSVSSEPAGARLRVDGEARGVTPWSGRLEVGPHQLEVTHEGYQPLRRDVALRPAEPPRAPADAHPPAGWRSGRGTTTAARLDVGSGGRGGGGDGGRGDARPAGALRLARAAGPAARARRGAAAARLGPGPGTGLQHPHRYRGRGPAGGHGPVLLRGELLTCARGWW